MFERQQFGWLLGRPALNDGIVGWSGVVIFQDFSTNVNTAVELEAILRERENDRTSALGCTASENLIAALRLDTARKIAPKIVDLSLAMRIASMQDEPKTTPQRTVDLLAECMSSISDLPGVALLEGRINEVGNFKEVDAVLRSLLRRLAQKLRRAGEFRRYIRYELPAHRVLLAQSKFGLLTNAEGVAAIMNETSSILRIERVELITKHGLDPADFIASFEARRSFAKRHLGVPRDRLTVGEFRELLDELVHADRMTNSVASFLNHEAGIRSLRTLATTDESGCQVMYDSIGTSTGRVVMKSPGAQWLEKKYRKHILPPEGYALRYLDYSCFEPTILAAVSGDRELLAACDSDAYERVSEWLGISKPDSRDLAKAILLRFIYGQSQDKLVEKLSAEAPLEPEDARSRLEGLERRLSRAFEFRSELAERARVNGYMDTLVGNRCLVEEGETFKALSHFLQGTGALIFKRALIDIFDGASVARLVVPMYDAFLCAFPTESLEDCVKHAAAAMRTAFLGVVGADLARVSVREEF